MALFKILAGLLYVLAGGWGYYQSRGDGKFSRPVFAALLCSMAGDVVLALDHKRGALFLLGVACFSAAHVLYSLAFCRVSALSWLDVAGALAVFAGLLSLLLLGDFAFQGLLPVIVGYAAVISLMVVKALSLWRCRREWGRAAVLVMCGGVLFLLSDMILLFWMFGRGMPRGVQYASLLVYYMAQGCLAASLSRDGRSILSPQKKV